MLQMFERVVGPLRTLFLSGLDINALMLYPWLLPLTTVHLRASGALTQFHLCTP